MPFPFMSKPAIKAALLQLHSIVGLAISLLLTMTALTGVTMSFEDEIQASLSAGISRVEARPARMLTPDQLIARLRDNHVDGKVSAITLSSDPSAAARMPTGGSRPSSIYVDPYDAHVLGTPRGEDFFATVRGLHRWLRIDTTTGEIVLSEIYADKIIGERIPSRILDIHRGSIFGWPGKLLFMLAGSRRTAWWHPLEAHARRLNDEPDRQHPKLTLVDIDHRINL
jgi:uncharacterized iron-regulated membrane protein